MDKRSIESDLFGLITDNVGYVKPAMAGLLILLAAPSAAFAESKFLSLGLGD